MSEVVTTKSAVSVAWEMFFLGFLAGTAWTLFWVVLGIIL